MKPNRLSPTLIIASLLLAGCATLPMSIPEAGSDDARLYEARCQQCHALPHPRRLTAAQWDHILELMQMRLQQRQLPELTDEELERLRGYLHRHARR